MFVYLGSVDDNPEELANDKEEWKVVWSSDGLQWPVEAEGEGKPALARSPSLATPLDVRL